MPKCDKGSTRALVIVPTILGLLLALVPVVDRNLYLSPARRKGLLIVAAIILIIVVAAGIYAVLTPVEAHLEA